MTVQYGLCKCFFSKNFFIRKYEIHVTFLNKAQFLEDFSKILKAKGCSDPEKLVPELEKEVERRQHAHEERRRHQLYVAEEYSRFHPKIFTLQSSFLDPRFCEMVSHARKPDCTADDLKAYMKGLQMRMYSFPVFTPSFCQMFVEELKHYETSSIPKFQAASMSKFAIDLGVLGFDQFLSDLRTAYLAPLVKVLYPDWGGDQLDTHKAFIAQYKEGRNLDTSYHFDNSEVTLNVSLNETFDDGDLYFGAMRGEESSFHTGYSHQLGRGILHRGQQMHGAFPIMEGERYNLIVWLRSSRIRNQLCPMCNEKPKIKAVENGFGDGFTLDDNTV